MATVTINRTSTLPNTSNKSDFHNLIDTATATVTTLDSTDFISGTSVVMRQSSAPSDTNVVWVDTNTTPYLIRIHDGTEWVGTGGYVVMTNKSGAQRTAGDVVIIDTTNNGAFTVSSTPSDPLAFGVVMETINDGSDGIVAITGSRVTSLKVTGAVSRGDRLCLGTQGRAQVGAANSFAIALASIGGAGTLSEALLIPSSFAVSTVGASGAYVQSLGSGVTPSMAFAFSKSKVVSASRNIATTTQLTITGVGFTPTAVAMIWNIDSTNNSGVGFADSSKTGGSITTMLDSGGNRASGTLGVFSNNISNFNTVTVNSYTSDGVVLDFAKTGTPTGTANVYFLFLG